MDTADHGVTRARTWLKFSTSRRLVLEMSFLAITEKSDSPFSALSRSVVESHLAFSIGLLSKGLVCRSPGRSNVSALQLTS